MRRWIALFTTLTLCMMPLCVRAEAWSAPKGREKNAPLKLLGALYEEQNMLVFSPLSLSVALGMATEGAAGESKAQLDEFLGDRRPDWAVLEDLRFSGVHMANAALIRPEFTILPAYVDALANTYDTEPLLMDEENVMNQVNAWVSENTNGLIENFLSEEPADETELLLLNALQMKAEWVSPFNPANTGFSVFHALTGDVEVSSMRQTELFLYGETEGIQSISLPYRDSPLEMIVLLPESGKLQPLIDELTAAPDEFIARHLPTEQTLVQLSLPNISAESSFELRDALVGMGVTAAFDPSLADFSGMTDSALDMQLHIGSVLQKAVLNVNETGTEAAAATQVAMLARGAMVQKTAEMNVDRPFMLLIHDPASGYVLFAACINNPA